MISKKWLYETQSTHSDSQSDPIGSEPISLGASYKTERVLQLPRDVQGPVGFETMLKYEASMTLREISATMHKLVVRRELL